MTEPKFLSGWDLRLARNEDCFPQHYCFQRVPVAYVFCTNCRPEYYCREALKLGMGKDFLPITSLIVVQNDAHSIQTWSGSDPGKPNLNVKTI